MKHYDFEAVQPRRGTGSMKWAEMEKYDCPEGVIPFSVADMELKVMPEVVDGLKEFLDKSRSATATRMSVLTPPSPLGARPPRLGHPSGVAARARRASSTPFLPPYMRSPPPATACCFSRRYIIQCIWPPRETTGRSLARRLSTTNGYYTIDFADLEAKAKRPDVKLMILCSPHNPCGRVWTREELEHIGRICLENNVVLFSDEIHSDLILPGYHHTPIGSLSDELAQNTLTAISPSKTFSLAGLQTSSVIVPNEALRKAFDEELKRHDGNPKCNILGLEACRIAYTEGDEWLDQLISILEENRRLIVEYLRREFPSVIVSPLEGTYLLWMDFRPLDIPADKLAELLRREAVPVL